MIDLSIDLAEPSRRKTPAFGQYKEAIMHLGGVLLVGLSAGLPLILSGFPPLTLDGAIHVRWAHNAALQFWSGSIYPRYFPELNNGFGSPSFFYYPPLSTLGAVLVWPFAPAQNRAWYSLGWSAALGLILSGVFMWFLVRNCTGHRWAATVAASLYVVAPYHLGVDLLDRGANAECWAFVFMPLLLLSFRRLTPENLPIYNNFFRQRASVPTRIAQAAFVLAALFCCHALTAIAFAPIAVSYAWLLGASTLRRATTAGVLALLLSAAYLLPVLTYGDYISGSQDSFFMGERFRQTFFFPDLQVQNPLATDDAYHRRLFVIFIGQVAIQIVCITALLLLFVPDRRRRTMVSLFVAMQLCTAMVLPVSEPLYTLIPALQRLQFTWRFLSPATFLCTIAIGILALPTPRHPFGGKLIFVLAAMISVLTSAWVNIRLYEQNGITKTGTWRAMASSINRYELDAFGEYVPLHGKMSVAQEFFRGSTNAAPCDVVLLSGRGEISVIEYGPRHFVIRCDSDNDVRLLLHQFWFPGWSAKDRITGEVITVNCEQRSGLLGILVPKGQREVDVRLRMLWPEAVGVVISLASGSCLLGAMAWAFWRSKGAGRVGKSNDPLTTGPLTPDMNPRTRR
jgi:hypothetical protein